MYVISKCLFLSKLSQNTGETQILIVQSLLPRRMDKSSPAAGAEEHQELGAGSAPVSRSPGECGCTGGRPLGCWGQPGGCASTLPVSSL